MSKKKPIIDIEKLVGKQKLPRRPFLKIKPPDGRTFFGYRLQFLDEPYERESRRFTDPKTGLPRVERHAEVRLLAWSNVEEQEIKGEVVKFEVGQEWRITISANLWFELEKHQPLKDKVFDIVNRGKPKGKPFYDYVAALQEGLLTTTRLRDLVESVKAYKKLEA